MFPSPLIAKPTDESLDRAAELILTGKLVAFPTETVYGLGADATNEHAVAAIYAAKGRPQFNPLIAHVAGTENIENFVEWNKTAQKLAAQFWPGPLTLVLPRAKGSPIALLASAGLETVAIRCPAHPVAQELIRRAGRPLAAPSANASGKLSPTLAAHVAESLGTKVNLILDGGACKVGVESSVLDLTTETPTLLRHGGVTKEMLQSFLDLRIREALHDDNAPKSPGMTLSHYAPSLPLRLNATSANASEAFLLFGKEEPLTGGAARLNLSPSGDLIEAAANLFSMLRALDRAELAGIAVAPIPESGIGAAINDRLKRAASENS